MSIDKIAGSAAAPLTSAASRPAERVASQARSAVAAIEPEAGPVQAEQVAPEVEQIAARLESYIRSVSRSLEFKVDAKSGRTVISVLDAQTGDLIRQIPNEEVLRFAELAEEQTVVLLNEKV